MKTEHSKLPWRVSGEAANAYVRISDSTNYTVAHTPWSSCIGRDGADAEFIVRACNSHYELVEALKACEDTLSELLTGGAESLTTDMLRSDYDLARSALIKANQNE